MRHLSQAWQTGLLPGVTPQLLVTLNTLGIDPSDDDAHLATQPGSLCLASHGAPHVESSRYGMTIPFAPELVGWPTVTKSMRRRDRRAEIAETVIKIGASADLGALLDDAADGVNLVGRVDAWIPGIDLADVIPLVAGPVSVEARPRDGGPVTIAIRDGDPDNGTSFPPDPITAVDFPDASREVVDSGLTPNWIMGHAPVVNCIPIDDLNDGEHELYLYCLPAARALPRTVRVDGVVSSDWRAFNSTTPTGKSCTLIAFDTPLAADAEVMALGGVGITGRDPISLLSEMAGFELTDETKALLAYERARPDRAFEMHTLNNVQAPIISLLRERLLGQTPFAMTFERGKLKLLRLDDATTQIPLRLGTELQFRLRDQPAPGDAPIYNSFIIECGRDDKGYLMQVRRDPDHGPAEVRALLALSVRLNGLRPYPGVIQAHDLAVAFDRNGNAVSCPAGDRLGDVLARTLSFAPRPCAYQIDWLTALSVERNDSALVTDDTYDDAPGYVETVALTERGPQMVVEVVDEVAAGM